MDARSLSPVVSLILLLAIGGCQSKTEAEKDSTGTGLAATQRLAGTWYGRARVDSAKVQAYLDSMADPVERERQTAIVQGFLTTEMAARFDVSGAMELDIQMQLPGKPVLRDSSQGRWSVLESSADAVLIQTVEQLPAGGTETNQVRYQFGQNDKVVLMTPPTSAWLATCDPVFVFERIEEPLADVAQQTGNDSGTK